MIDRNVEAPLRQNPEVVARRLDNTAVLVNIATNRIFELNETGAKVWELLGEGVDTDGIVRRLVDEFDVEERRAADEVKNLIVQLQTEGLLVR
jgi:Coenzyme PQQ synthesis protein D (PqqD)